jgi:Caspase domain
MTVTTCLISYQHHRSSLCVPQSHIVVLTNEGATRYAILSSFENHLVQNNRIKKGDPIVWYYAGHGSRVEAPSGWLTGDNMIETICPYDEQTRDANDDFMHSIS